MVKYAGEANFGPHLLTQVFILAFLFLTKTDLITDTTPFLAI